MKEYKVEELSNFYNHAETCDKEAFSEMRTNILLMSGDHYARKNAQFLNRIKDFKDISDQQKLRLTKNHTQKIIKTYANFILSSAPDVTFMPRNEKELSDIKAAELHQSVWEYSKDQYNFDEKNDDFIDDFLVLGEVACKIIYNPREGRVIAYHQAMSEDGQPLFEEDGVTPKKGDPVFEGGFTLKPIPAYNLLRCADVNDMKESPYLIERYMIGIKDLKAKFPEFKDKIQTSNYDKTFTVFDGQRGSYSTNTKDMALVKEFYFKPCAEYPNGYYYIVNEDIILEKGELPGGIFPIVWQYLDKANTTPRGISPIRVGRPYQSEINRASSKIAEHQITLGDDKLIIQSGTKISAGVALPGVRSINVAGRDPTILAGRDGSQYLNYLNSQITEYYSVMNVPETDNKDLGQLDPYYLLYKSASQKKFFSRYIRRYERFLKAVAKTYLKMAKLYMKEEALVPAIGRNEYVNIAEFKNANDINYEIKIVPQADDVDSKLGQQIFTGQVLQYVGSKLERDDIGKIIVNAPFSNNKEMFSDFTLNYDTATNLILSLDRGEEPYIYKFDDKDYMIKRLTSRMRLADFRTLDPNIQNRYEQVLKLYEEMKVRELEEIQRAEQGLIPTDGYMVTLDLYVPDPSSPAKSRRARLPYSSVVWLIKQLELQGKSLAVLEQMNEGVVADMAKMLGSNGGMSPSNVTDVISQPSVTGNIG